MIDRCAGCGLPLQKHKACCIGAGYWSLREPWAEDEAAFGMLRIAGYCYYGNIYSPRFDWSPLEEPKGFHPGDPAHVLKVYRAYLDHAERSFGARSLLHYKEFVLSITWAEREIEARE